MQALMTLVAHNQWANGQIFGACSELSHTKLSERSHGYASVLEILNHLVQVENAFLELAHGRRPQWDPLAELAALQAACSRIDQAYLEYVGELEPEAAEEKRFLVPWFGFEITLVEGVLQPMTHSHKHRADVSMLLPLLGGAGTEMDLIQWLAAERQG